MKLLINIKNTKILMKQDLKKGKKKPESLRLRTGNYSNWKIDLIKKKDFFFHFFSFFQ